MGTIGLFLLGVTLLQTLTAFAGSPSLLYMLPRYDNFQLLSLSYFFGIIANIVVCIVLYAINIILWKFFGMYATNLIPWEFWEMILLSSLFCTFHAVNTQFFLSKEKITLYNFFIILQMLLMAGLLLLFVFVFKQRDVSIYVYAHFLSYGISGLFSCLFLFKKVSFQGFKGIFSLLKKMLKYGFVIQIANLAQLFNTRLGFYVIESLTTGRKPLGLYNFGTKLTETIWSLPQSIASVQYARIVNRQEDKEYAKKISLVFLKLAFILSLMGAIFLLFFPDQWIGYIFKEEFIEAKRVFYALGLGIVIFSGNIIISTYFCGFGKYKVNMTASLIGLAVLGICCLVGIPYLKQTDYQDIIFAVGLMTSLSYLSSFTYAFIRFAKDTKLKFSELKIGKQDIFILKREIRKIRDAIKRYSSVKPKIDTI
jgi:O-antigen/teichoic acid export membrane protein